jgi:hypothetical protein
MRADRPQQDDAEGAAERQQPVARPSARRVQPPGCLRAGARAASGTGSPARPDRNAACPRLANMR